MTPNDMWCKWVTLAATALVHGVIRHQQKRNLSVINTICHRLVKSWYRRHQAWHEALCWEPNGIPVPGCSGHGPPTSNLFRVVCVDTDTPFDGIIYLRMSDDEANGSRRAARRICRSVRSVVYQCNLHRIRNVRRCFLLQSCHTSPDGTHLASDTRGSRALRQTKIAHFQYLVPFSVC